jgi:hypothetical protein
MQIGLALIIIGILLAIFTTPYAGVVVLIGAVAFVWGAIVGSRVG